MQFPTHLPTLTKQQQEAKLWHDRYQVDTYLSQLCTKLVNNRPGDANSFVLKDLISHCSDEQLSAAGLRRWADTTGADAGNSKPGSGSQKERKPTK